MGKRSVRKVNAKIQSINCQAKAAAIFTGLSKAGVLKEALNDRNLFLKLVYNYEKTEKQKEPEYNQMTLELK